jgi:uncharacterized protein YodC (DUF2158 family)
MAQQLKVGDVVKLKSGGPLMTVTLVGPDMSGIMTAWCVWFAGQVRVEGTFPLEAVELNS